MALYGATKITGGPIKNFSVPYRYESWQDSHGRNVLHGDTRDVYAWSTSALIDFQAFPLTLLNLVHIAYRKQVLVSRLSKEKILKLENFFCLIMNPYSSPGNDSTPLPFNILCLYYENWLSWLIKRIWIICIFWPKRFRILATWSIHSSFSWSARNWCSWPTNTKKKKVEG